MFHEITSVSNPKIKEVAKLRDGKQRRRSGRFLIDGVRETRRALAGTVEIIEVYALEKQLGLLDELTKNRPEISPYFVSEKVFDKIAFGNRTEGILAVARWPERSLAVFEAELQNIKSPLIAVLEGVEKPGNVGATLRSADGAGLDGVVMADCPCDLFNPNTIRGSLGTIFRLPIAEARPSEVLSWLRDREIAMAVARCDGSIPYTDYDFRKPTAIVLGSESNGLTDLWRGDEVTAISLPMHGIADSLNVSVAAAILFYEARRQRGVKKTNKSN